MHNWIARIAVFLVLTGCEPLADELTQGTALATLHGTLSLAQGAKPPAGALHVSVIWRDPTVSGADAPNTCDDAQLKGWRYETRLLEQRVELTTDFPSGFSVSLTEPPPPAALFDDVDGKGVSSAFGDLVVYDDRNGNDRLDPRDFDGTSPDLVFGWSQGTSPGSVPGKQYTISYLSRDLEQPNEATGAGKAGYSLETIEFGVAGTINSRSQRLSEATIDLALDPNAYVQQSACAVRCYVAPENVDCPDDPRTLLNADMGEQLTADYGIGSAAWLRQDGDTSVFTQTQCQHPLAGPGGGTGHSYVFSFGSTTTQGCTWTSLDCTYNRAAYSAEDADLPCTQYQDVTPGPSQPPPNDPPH